MKFRKNTGAHAAREKKALAPDRIRYYFRQEAGTLFLVTLTGILYNAGLAAGPWFEGLLVQCLFDIMNGTKTFRNMAVLSVSYLAVILFVQSMRAVKRFTVRRFANNTSRSMRRILYGRLVHMSRAELEKENLGSVMTKAVADVDTCAEGMRKFTTEIFDTGVVLIVYLVMLLSYDPRLTLLSCAFTPFAYLIADSLKTRVSGSSAAMKVSAGQLSGATMDRITNALTYRVYGCEENRDRAYETRLSDYEKRSVAANLWENTMQPLYNVISMCGAVLILYFGARNVLGTGWTHWNIAAFTTFFSCFSKLALKSSHAAKLFNSVQKAKVSWDRIRPLMQAYDDSDYTDPHSTGAAASGPVPSASPDERAPQDVPASAPAVPASAPAASASAPAASASAPAAAAAAGSSAGLTLSGVSVCRPGDAPVLSGLSFAVLPGSIIGVTGPVASGKSTLGKVFIGEVPYTGSIRLNGRELRELNSYERSRLISYMGHEPELMADTIDENIRLGASGDTAAFLRAVRLDGETAEMPEGAGTFIGSGGVRLSGGQQARVALARTLFNGRYLLVLDDPFSAVDRTTEAEIMENLRAFAKDRLVLLFSHRLYLFPTFDSVLFLNGGTGVFSTHEELLRTSPAYAQLYLEQTKGGNGHEEQS